MNPHTLALVNEAADRVRAEAGHLTRALDAFQGRAVAQGGESDPRLEALEAFQATVWSLAIAAAELRPGDLAPDADAEDPTWPRLSFDRVQALAAGLIERHRQALFAAPTPVAPANGTPGLAPPDVAAQEVRRALGVA